MATINPKPHRTPNDDDLGIVDGLVQLSFLVQAVLGRVATGYDVSIIQARLIGVLRGRELGMAQLARVLNLDKSSTTGLVDRAEGRGLVRRTTVPGDGRAVHVVLTAKGEKLAKAFAAEVEEQLIELRRASFASQDMREGMKAFAEKRPPRWRGV